MVNLPEKIYGIMEEKSMKQSLVARAAGYSPKAFNAMLRNRKAIKPEDIPRICGALRVISACRSLIAKYKATHGTVFP